MQNQKKRSELKRPKFSFILILGLVLIVGSFIITFFSNEFAIREKKQELAQKQQQYEQISQENDYKQSVLDNDDKSDFLEQEARKNGYGYPNEKVFYDITPGE